jgi:predicted nucleic acid-binding protein
MVLDTNILIAYLKGDPEIVAALGQWRREGRGLVASSISFAEVLALPALSGSEIGW